MRTVRFGRECAKGIAGSRCSDCVNCMSVNQYSGSVACNVNAPKLIAVGVPSYKRPIVVGDNGIHYPKFREVERW